MYVRWNGNLSNGFKVTNSVRQAEILSPYLSNVYLDDLSKILNNAHIGCLHNGVQINHLFYADHAMLLAPSPQSMQTLLNVCENFAGRTELVYK